MKIVFKLILVELVILIAAIAAPAQTTQHFVVSGAASGQPSAIASTGVQLTSNISVAYEYISNPNDSNALRVGSGVANYTRQVSSFIPKSLASKLLIDPSNYLVTFQAGAGRESLAGATASSPRVQHIVGNFGIYSSKPVAPHAQLGLGYKFILGPQSQLIKVPVGTLNFTF